MAEPILKVEKISKAFPGVLALDAVDFDLYPGEVHVLLGENGAGKSTLVKLISGVYQKDSGRFLLNGEKVEIDSVKKAQELGITTIYQELDLAPNLTVAQNIFLGREPCKKSIGNMVIDKKAVRERTMEILKSLKVDISPEAMVQELSVPLQQMVGIAKALSIEAKVIIFDEPTAALTEKETMALFAIIKALKEHGLGIIYISHRLEEIFRIGDRVTVFRDGRKIDTVKLENTSTESLIKMMVGRELSDQYPRSFSDSGGPGETVLELNGIFYKKELSDVSLKVRKGEIIGIAGLVGSGQTELARVIFGLHQPDAGEIKIFGKARKIGSPSEAIKLGIALVPEERKQLGLFQSLSVNENIIISVMRKLFGHGIIRRKKTSDVSQRFVERLNIKTPGLDHLVEFLSGGNQQKVVIAKWLATKARLFIFNEPTRGIDVGAKREIYKLMDELTRSGGSVLMISSEIPEILGMSDRIYVMHEGRITAEYSRHEATQEKILESAMGR